MCVCVCVCVQKIESLCFIPKTNTICKSIKLQFKKKTEYIIWSKVDGNSNPSSITYYLRGLGKLLESLNFLICRRGCCCCCCWVTSVVSNSMRPQRRQPTRLPCPWDSPGKNTGMGCHCLLQVEGVSNSNSNAYSYSENSLRECL